VYVRGRGRERERTDRERGEKRNQICERKDEERKSEAE
jgi:hypothetical protein